MECIINNPEATTVSGRITTSLRRAALTAVTGGSTDEIRKAASMRSRLTSANSDYEAVVIRDGQHIQTLAEAFETRDREISNTFQT